MRKIKKLTLGYSVLSDYRKCGTYFLNRYLKNLSKPTQIRTDKGSPLSFGTAVHEFMEFYHAGVPFQDILDQVIGKASLSALANVNPASPRSVLHLELLLKAYQARYPNPVSDFRPFDKLEGKPAFEFEVQFVLSQSPLIVWRQRYDGLIQLENGDLAILEHKTSSGDLRKDLRDRMLPNAQAVGYVYGARRVLELPVKGVLFNGLSTYRPLVNPDYKFRGQGEKQPLFTRELVKIEDWHLDEWLSQTLRDAKRMIEDIEENVFGANAPNACTIFNQRCVYADLCLAKPSDRIVLEDLAYETDLYDGFKIEFEE